MQRATQVELIRRYLALDEAGTTTLAPEVLRLPVDAYLSPERFGGEVSLLRSRPVVACLSCDVARPGDFVTIDSGGVPIVVVRDDHGVLRAFVNACRHRNAPVAQGCGNAGRFVCPFHAWSYSLDGALTARPRSLGGFDGEPPTSMTPIAAAEAHGLVWVLPDGDGPIDVPALLCGLGSELDSYRLDGYVPYARRSSSWACNWKLIVDTYLESYHVFSLHRSTVGPDYPGHVMLFDGFGTNLRFPVPRASLLTLRDQPEAEWDFLAHATVQYLLAPNTIVNHTVDHVLTWRFIPRAVDRTDIEMCFYVPESPVDDERRAYWDQWVDLHVDVTYIEDFPESERIHRTMASGRATDNVLGRNEVAVQHFHRSLQSLLDAAPRSPRL